MGINFNSNLLEIKNYDGATKFRLDRRMPHFILNVTGEITIPKIIGDTDGNRVNRIDTEDIILNPLINNSNYFILPFYTIDGGEADTNDRVMPGGASILTRLIINTSANKIIGSTITDLLVENGAIRMQFKQNIDKDNGYGSAVPYSGDDDVTLQYRIYYGRFS